MDEFEIRTYSKKELAFMYFPNAANGRTAVNMLMRWINRCKALREELDAAGYQPNARYLTPRQVKLIVEMLGEP